LLLFAHKEHEQTAAAFGRYFAHKKMEEKKEKDL